MKLDASQVRQWLANFEVAKQVERDLTQKEGPRPAWSIATALSLIAAAEKTTGGLRAEPGREQQEVAVRATWAKLRQRLAA